MTTWTIEAPESKADQIAEAIAKLNKRAKRLGIKPLAMGDSKPLRVEELRANEYVTEWLIVGSDEHAKRLKQKGAGMTGRYRTIREYVVTGEVPALNGWQAIAVIDAVENGSIIRSIPLPSGERAEVPEAYATTSRCDHCNKSRNRKTAVVVRKGGKLMTVGKSCLKDFCPELRSPERVMLLVRDMIQTVAERDWCEEDKGGSLREMMWSVASVVELSVATVRKDGYRKAGSDSSTGGLIRFILNPPSPASQAYKYWQTVRNEYEPTAADKEKALEVIEFAKTIEGSSEYCRNLRTLASGDYVGYKHIGLLGSAIAAYNRNHAEAVEAKATEDTPLGLFKARLTAGTLQHVGEVKKRFDTAVTVTGLHYFDNEWGTTTIVRMVDDSGEQLVWFASNDPFVQVGNRYEVRATVKKHDVDRHNGHPLTILTRIKLPKGA